MLVASAVSGAAAYAVSRQISDAPVASLHERIVQAAQDDAIDAMREYSSWLAEKDQWSLNGTVGPCPSKVDGLAELKGYTFLSFDGDENRRDGSDDTKVVLYRGTPKDLAEAEHVAFLVPGTGTTWSNGLSWSQPSLGQGGLNCPQHGDVKPGNWIGSADLIADTAAESTPHERTVVIAWLGYDAPKLTTPEGLDWDTPETARTIEKEFVTGATPASSLFAHEGGTLLAQHVNRFTRQSQHVTLIGHSYGSGVVGYALWEYAARGVDEIIGGGAPGLAVRRGVDTDSRTRNPLPGVSNDDSCFGYKSSRALPQHVKYTRDCLRNVDPAHFWAMQTPDDWLIGKGAKVCNIASGADRCGFFGDTLHGNRFGAHEMQTNGDSYPKISEHGDYFRKVARGHDRGKIPLSVWNTAWVVTGRYDLVVRESDAPGVAYPTSRRPRDATTSTTEPGPADTAGTSRFVGVWRGDVAQPGGSISSYGIILRLEESSTGDITGTVEYPGADCSGEVTFVRLEAATLVLRERILLGAGPCAPTGLMSLTLVDDGSANWSYIDNGMGPATAHVTRRSS